MNTCFAGYFLCPVEYSDLFRGNGAPVANGYFSFGPDAICFGHYGGRYTSSEPSGRLDDGSKDVVIEDGNAYLPFDPDEVVENLWSEKYIDYSRAGFRLLAYPYYFIRPVLSVGLRRWLQRFHLRDWKNRSFPRWPVDCSVDDLFASLMLLSLRASGAKRIPFIWFWPEGKNSCALMTHDVESNRGRDFCSTLMDIDDSRRVKSSFQVIPEERYDVSEVFLRSIRERGFELAVHDLNHDGHLYRSFTQFLQRSVKINAYLKQYKTQGFRAGALYRRQSWYHALECSYDMSVPNVAHLDPQRGGCCTVMPYFVGDVLEIPLTTVQDYTLFHILDDYSIDLWKSQIEIIMRRHGLMSFIVHPDYVREPRAQAVYERLLDYLLELRQNSDVWSATPSEINRWWRQRSAMRLMNVRGRWEIQGEGSERARLAYASEVDGRLMLTPADSPEELSERPTSTISPQTQDVTTMR